MSASSARAVRSRFFISGTATIPESDFDALDLEVRRTVHDRRAGTDAVPGTGRTQEESIDGLDSIAFDPHLPGRYRGRLGGGHRVGPPGLMDRRMDR
nr:hypothetical protein [Streptomyces sp. TSRI0445]